jgi:hypothetical protein
MTGDNPYQAPESHHSKLSDSQHEEPALFPTLIVVIGISLAIGCLFMAVVIVITCAVAGG